MTPFAAPTALAVAGASAATATIYVHLSAMGLGSLIRSDDGGATWTDLTGSLPLQGPRVRNVTNLVTNPAQPQWLYVSEWAQDQGSGPARMGVFASHDRGQTWVELAGLEQRVNGPHGLALAIPSRTLFAANDCGVYQNPIAWTVLPRVRAYYDANDGYPLVGTAMSLQTEVQGRASQYFAQGRLEDHSG